MSCFLVLCVVPPVMSGPSRHLYPLAWERMLVTITTEVNKKMNIMGYAISSDVALNMYSLLLA
jgi:hypothetical protein